MAKPKHADWTDRAKRYLKAELKRAEVTYEELAEKLTEMGMEETTGSVSMKINRGTFSATFFLAALVAIGAEIIKLEDL